MAKRKTSCGNARMFSMLLTNGTRSASYEALPKHRLFPARSGLTSRFPLRHRCLRQLRSNKSGDAVGRPSCRSSLLGDPGTKFLVETSRTVKNSLNYVSTCLRVVDTRRLGSLVTFREFKPLFGHWIHGKWVIGQVVGSRYHTAEDAGFERYGR